MLKKSLIPAALIALSSVSAFADSESSFYLGVKGLYFMPKKEVSEDMKSAIEANFPSCSPTCQTRGIFLPGLQFGYNISDSIRIGLAGYFGASKFKYEPNIGLLNAQFVNESVNKIVADLQTLDLRAAAAAAALAAAGSGAAVAIKVEAAATAAATRIIAVSPNTLKNALILAAKDYQGKVKENPVPAFPFLSKCDKSSADIFIGNATGITGDKDPNSKAAGGLITKYPATLVKELTVELSPRVALFATMDAKFFESDSFSLGMGIGVGAAKWKLSINGEGQVSGASQDLSADFSAWKPAFMGTVNANVNIGDVAVLTGSVGYAHLGDPKGLKKSDDKAQTEDADSNKAKGFIFGIGIGKEF
jgi:hypothetical protein